MAGYRIPGPICVTRSETMDEGTMCLGRTPLPGPLGPGFENDILASLLTGGTGGHPYCWGNIDPYGSRRSAFQFGMSREGLSLLKSVERLRLKPYDDQTGSDATAWTAGATIGYGHLIAQDEWKAYEGGISESDAEALFRSDLAPFVTTVGDVVTALVSQSEFDALVMLAFNIGRGSFARSSAVRLVNDPSAVTAYRTLEEAWKAWNKSQGKVMKGLDNRRNCEWNVYARGIYQGW